MDIKMIKLVKESLNDVDKNHFDWAPEPSRKGLTRYIADHIAKIKGEEASDDDRHKVEDFLMEDPEFNTALKKIILMNF